MDRLNIIIAKEIEVVHGKSRAASDPLSIFNLEQDAWANYLWQACDPAGHSRNKASQNRCISTALMYRATALAAHLGENQDFGFVPDDLESVLSMQLTGD